jgi:hypothetical protein
MKPVAPVTNTRILFLLLSDGRGSRDAGPGINQGELTMPAFW